MCLIKYVSANHRAEDIYIFSSVVPISETLTKMRDTREELRQLYD